jgi:hypothetical protein
MLSVVILSVAVPVELLPHRHKVEGSILAAAGGIFGGKRRNDVKNGDRVDLKRRFSTQRFITTLNYVLQT